MVKSPFVSSSWGSQLTRISRRMTPEETAQAALTNELEQLKVWLESWLQPVNLELLKRSLTPSQPRVETPRSEMAKHVHRIFKRYRDRGQVFTIKDLVERIGRSEVWIQQLLKEYPE